MVQYSCTNSVALSRARKVSLRGAIPGLPNRLHWLAPRSPGWLGMVRSLAAVLQVAGGHPCLFPHPSATGSSLASLGARISLFLVIKIRFHQARPHVLAASLTPVGCPVWVGFVGALCVFLFTCTPYLREACSSNHLWQCRDS